MRISAFSGVLLALALAATAWPASSAEVSMPASTLKKIKQTRVVVIGYRESSMPFSYLDQNRRPIGYSMDICHHVVGVLKNDLAISDLKIEYKLVTPKDRIKLVKEGAVDIECGSTTNNRERQREVAFSKTTFVAASRLVAKKGSGIRMLISLKNKTVVSTAGTTPLTLLKEFNETYRYNMTILEGKDHAESFAMVEDGRAAAFAMDDILLASMVANAKNPSEFALTVQALSIEPYGMIIRRGDPAFKRAVDDAIVALFRSGEIRKIYTKWFQSPIPPKGVNLNVPMSDVLEKVIKNPTDSGNPASYH